MLYLRSLLFNTFFFVWTALTLIVSVFTLIFPRGCVMFVLRVWAKGLSLALRILIGIKYEVRGRENISASGRIYACKHQSVWETFMFYAILNDPAYIMKKELMQIPLWGWCVKKCRSISIDRDGGGAALKTMIADVKDRIADNRQIIIFPEGTRTVAGSRLPFHPGVAALYSMSGAAVVPVAVNSGLFWGRHNFLKYPGTVVIEFLPEMPSGLKSKVFLKNIQEQINTAADRLLEEGKEKHPLAGSSIKQGDSAS